MRHSYWFRTSLVLLGMVFNVTAVAAAPLGTAFTHKGECKPCGTILLPGGIFDFQIVLFNVATLGTPIVSPVIYENVPVTQGNFTVEINYGASPFATATQYWLETRVRLGTSTGVFIPLPRQKLNAVPYALNVRTLPPGIVTGTSIAPNAVGPVAILDNSITAADIGINAVGLAEINPTQVQTRVSGICAPGLSMRAIAQNGTVICEAGGITAWRLLGNAGTNPATHFLGTADNQPLNVRVNNQRVLRLEPNAISPNIIGGNSANFALPGVRGATISGGGVPTGDTDPNFVNEGPNRVTDAYGTIAGGYNNQAGDNAGTVIDSSFATVGGGSATPRAATPRWRGARITPRAATPVRWRGATATPRAAITASCLDFGPRTLVPLTTACLCSPTPRTSTSSALAPIPSTSARKTACTSTPKPISSLALRSARCSICGTPLMASEYRTILSTFAPVINLRGIKVALTPMGNSTLAQGEFN